MLIDQESKKSGSLLVDFDPPVVPPKEIDDPEDEKPDDWVEEEMYGNFFVYCVCVCVWCVCVCEF